MGVFYRLWLLWLIPLRIAYELFTCFVWNPRRGGTKISRSRHVSFNDESNPNNESNGTSNGSLEVTNLNGTKQKRLNDALDKWWGPTTPLKGLLRMNQVRLPIIIEAYLKDVLKRDFTKEDLTHLSPLLGAKVCDIGCGGGYLSEALADAGADVTGVDFNVDDLMAAKAHWTNTRGENAVGPEYVYTSNMKRFSRDRQGQYDLVICSELIEHLDDPMTFVGYCCEMVRLGGGIVFTTNNRTLSGLMFAIIWLEHVVDIIPFNVHQFYKFIKPTEVDNAVRKHGFKTTNIAGYLPLGLTLSLRWRLTWVLTSFTGIWYALVAVKE